MLTHGNTTVNALGAIAELGITDADIWGHVAPIFHLADAWSLFAVTWAGGTHVFVPYFKAPEVVRAFEKEKVTLTVLVPTMVQSLLHQVSLNGGGDFSLRLVLTAGSPIAPEMVRNIVFQLKCDYLQFYGMTETSPFLTLSKPKAEHERSIARAPA